MLCIESQVTPSPGCSSTRCLNNIFPPKGVLVLETERGGCIIKGYENEGKNQEYVICGGKRLCVSIKNKIKLCGFVIKLILLFPNWEVSMP